jgi:hypothetical protein
MESVVPALLQIAQGRVVGGFVEGSLGAWDGSFFPALSVCTPQMRNVKRLAQLVFVPLREGVRGNLILVRGLAAILQIRSRESVVWTKILIVWYWIVVERICMGWTLVL